MNGIVLCVYRTTTGNKKITVTFHFPDCLTKIPSQLKKNNIAFLPSSKVLLEALVFMFVMSASKN